MGKVSRSCARKGSSAAVGAQSATVLSRTGVTPAGCLAGEHQHLWCALHTDTPLASLRLLLDLPFALNFPFVIPRCILLSQ